MHISQLAAVGSRLYAATLGGVYVSNDAGSSWAADKVSPKNVNRYLVINNQILAGTDDSAVFLSADNGVSWAALGTGLPDTSRIWSLVANGNNVFAGTDSGIWRLSCGGI